MTSAQEFNCIFCKDSFDNKEELQIHFRKHGDPKFNQNVKSNKSKLLSEMASVGEKSEEGDVVRCDVCPEVFPTISKAITHKHKVHPDHDAKYFCPWCGKLFTMKHLYNKHIQTNHDFQEENGQTGFHCDYCEVNFFVPSAMVYHNKFFHRQDTELAAIGQSKKLKMFNQEPLQIYYCPFCGEEYNNKVNLHKHMGDDHIDENQSPQDVLRCPLCDAIFYHLDAYELHLTFHSTEDLYSEENEMAKQLTEFSLETAAPIMEKVENELQDEQTVESIGIEELLHQAMNESNDNTNEGGVREKKKKHKKHKKSKKSAITLDEFLTMNQDVFGEGIDFQGIEEVPTQVVAKQLKRKSMAHKFKSGAKSLPSAELEKLKQHGIVVKKNSAKCSNKFQSVKIGNKKSLNAINVMQNFNKANLSKQAIPSTVSSNALLSKFLNQSNSQIKIVKKSTGNSSLNNVSVDKVPPNLIETEPHIVNDEAKTETDSEKITKVDGVDIFTKIDNKIEEDLNNEIDKNHAAQDNSQDSIKQGVKVDSPSHETDFDDKEETFQENDDELQKPDKYTEKANAGIEKRNTMDKVNVLKNISQHVTIKPISSPNNAAVDLKPKLHVNEALEEKNTNVDRTESSKEATYINRPNKQSLADENNTSKKSLNVIQHLRHLTVKPVNMIKNSTQSIISENVSTKASESREEQKENSYEDKDKGTEEARLAQDALIEESETTDVLNDNFNASLKLEVIKNISKHITVKSLSQTQTCDRVANIKKEVPNNNDTEANYDKNFDDFSQNQNKDLPNNHGNIKSFANITSPEGSNSLTHHQKSRDELRDPNVKNQLRIPNQIAKPGKIVRNFKQQALVPCATQLYKTQQKNIQSNAKKEGKIDEEIEIFNIDDSDDEDNVSQDSNFSQTNNKETVVASKIVDSERSTEKSVDILKNLSKHIIVKPKNQQLIKREIQDSDEMFEDNLGESEFDEEVQSSTNENNTMLQNKLKNLSNITIKSRNSSLKMTPISQNSEKVDSHIDEDDDDSNTSTKEKINELPDNYTSDDDVPIEKQQTNDIQLTKSDATQETYYTDSDNEFNHEEEDEDFENFIKPNTLKKPTQESSKRPACLNNLQNLTIKSSKESKIEDEKCSKVMQKESPLKPSKPIKFVNRDCEESPTKHIRQHSGQIINQNPSKSSGQVNTINKEVSVQTFQTKTVIQEITTTVTKTIRTVNQTTKQTVQSTSQSNSASIRPQKIIGPRSHQQMKSFQGMPVRTATPTMGPRIRNTISRPAITNSVRPSNQLVLVRPGMNIVRPSNPRTLVVRKPVATSSNLNKAVTGKPLKISPNALMPSMKRPTSEETSGPFSCFKKPKESLIPEVPVFNNQQGESMQFASSSHVSKSNFTSTSKTIKGNAVVTSTQMQSEVSASSKQLTRLNNMSGLKIMKTSQTQSSKAEEKTEISATQRSTLEAIEKLQKQGLLIKKPRLEDSNNCNEHSQLDTDDDYYDDT